MPQCGRNGEVATSIAECRRIERGKLFDLAICQLYRHAAHAGVNVIASSICLERLELTREIFPVLVRKRRCLDRAACIEAVARIAGWKAARRIAPLDEPDDVLVDHLGRRRIEVPPRARGEMGGHVDDLLIVRAPGLCLS